MEQKADPIGISSATFANYQRMIFSRLLLPVRLNLGDPTVSIRVHALLILLLAGYLLAPAAVRAQAPASEYLLPDTTRLLLSLPDPDVARERFNASQFGELVNHEKMAKFMDDLQEQLKDTGRMAERLGIAPSDLDGVYDGEIALAAIQPGGAKDAFATALIVKITPGDPEGVAQNMLREVVNRRLTKFKGSDTAFVDFDPQREKEVYRLTTPKVGEKPQISTYYFFQGTFFVAVDHEEEARALYKRIAEVSTNGKEAAGDSLATIAPFKVGMERVAAAWDAGEPHLRWFLDPFNFMRLRRAEQLATGAREEERGRVMIEVYADEGFDALQGVSGWLNFSAGGHEVLHRSFVYAPPIDRTSEDPRVVERLEIEKKMSDIPEGVKYEGPPNDRYLLGARVMHFFNGGDLNPQGWVPNDIAAHLTFKWYMQRAFKYSETLFNAYSDDVKNQEVWWGTIDSIRDDPDGPMVDIRKEIVMQLGTRATYVSDYAKPIDVDSEQTAVALEITGDEKTVATAIDKMMANDPDAVKHTVGETTIWEIVPPPSEREGEEQSTTPASYMVTVGHLFRASHADILKKLAAMPAKQLAEAEDLKSVNAALDELSDGEESARYFDRLDRSLEQNWELVRMGKFPQSDSLLANMAARAQGFDPEDPETKEREQEIDGDNLPKFEFAKPFLGPSGLVIKSVDEGWVVSGAVLTKE